MNVLQARHDDPDGTDDVSSPAVSDPPHVALTEREHAVLAGIARGLSNAEIASELFVSVETVKSHARRIYGKLGVRNRTEATVRSLQHPQLLDLQPLDQAR